MVGGATTVCLDVTVLTPATTSQGNVNVSENEYIYSRGNQLIFILYTYSVRVETPIIGNRRNCGWWESTTPLLCPI